MNKRKRKRNVLTYEDQFEVLKKIKAGISKDSILQDYNISNTTYKEIVNCEEDILENVTSYKNSEYLKKVKYRKLLDDAVLKWFLQARDRGGDHVTGPVIQRKAFSFHTMLFGSNSPFDASNLWLHRFKERYGITKYQMKKINPQSKQRFMQFIKQKMDVNNIPLENIYNADESGIYWRALATWLIGRETSKNLGIEREITENDDGDERLTALFCSNAIGDHRIPLLLVGNSFISKQESQELSLQYFENMDVFYTQHCKARIDEQIFMLWYKDVFIPRVLEYQKISGTSGKVVLILDNAPCHSNLRELNSVNKNFEIVLLHCNLMPCHQPMQQGLILATKKLYKKCLLKQLLSNNKTKDPDESITNLELTDCFIFLTSAWNSLKLSTIQKAWNAVFGRIFTVFQDPLFAGQSRDRIVDSSTCDIEESLKFPHEIEDQLCQLLSKKECSAEKVKNLLLEWFEIEHIDCGWEPMTDDEILEFVMNEEKLKESETEETLRNTAMQQLTSRKEFEDENIHVNETVNENEDPLQIFDMQQVIQPKISQNQTVIQGLIKSEINITSEIADVKMDNEIAESVRKEYESVDERIMKGNQVTESQVTESQVAESIIEEIKIDDSEIEEIDIEESKLEERIFEKEDIGELEEMDIENKINENRIDENNIEEDRIEESRIEKSRIEENRIGESRIEESRIEESRIEESRIEKSRIEESRIGENRIEENVRELEEIKVEEMDIEETRVEENNVRGIEATRVDGIGIEIERNCIREVEEIGNEGSKVVENEVGIVEEIILEKSVVSGNEINFVIPETEKVSPSEAFKGLMNFKKWMQSCEQSLQQHHCYVEELEDLLTQ